MVRGNGRILFGAGLRRTLLEVEIIALVGFGLSLNAIVVPDYSLAVLADLIGGLLALLWAGLRLRRIGRGFVQKIGALLLIGVVVSVQIVLTAFALLATSYPIADFALATWPITDPAFKDVPPGLLRLLNLILSAPDEPYPDMSVTTILVARLSVSALQLVFVYVVLRVFIVVCALPGRWIARLRARRLLWRLAFSHFSVVLASLTLTVVGWTLLIVLISSASNESGGPARLIGAEDARRVARVLAAESNNGTLTADEMNDALRRFREGASVTIAPTTRAARIVNALRASNLADTDYIVVTDMRAQVVASTDPARFPPNGLQADPDAAQLQPLIARALSGSTVLEGLAYAKSSPNLVIAGAYPVIIARTPQYVVVVREHATVAITQAVIGLGTILALGVVTVVGLLAVSVFSLGAAFLFGFLTSRRLVRDLETLAVGADALAAGQLRQPVRIDAEDEVGRLAARFNTMAARLQESQTNLAREKQIVEQALQTKRELVASVSHELRTPVSTISAHVDWLLQARERLQAQPSADAGSDPDELWHYLAIIEREAQRLSALIDDLLDLSRVEARPTEVQREIVDVVGVVQDVRQTLGLLAQQERKIALSLNIAPGTPPVWADRARLTQVLLNLTRNALNYTPEGGIVVIGLRPLFTGNGAGRVELRVMDTGIGIAPGDLNRIFERFYRSDSSRSRNTGGAGLGLAIVKTLVEAMGGTIAVQSVIGEGSTFIVTLGAAPAVRLMPTVPLG